MYNHNNPFTNKKTYKHTSTYNTIKRNRAFRSEKSNPTLIQSSPKYNKPHIPKRVSKHN